MNILFIGNSFTYYHDMPDLLMQIAKSAGVDLYAEHVTKGGYRLCQHSDWETEDGKRTDAALRSRAWDYVVLQEQSMTPVSAREVFLPAAAELCKTVRAFGAKPVFYQTWSYRDGTEKLATTGLSYGDFYRGLKDAYTAAAEENGAFQVRVGDVFYALNQPRGGLDLICPDNFHPSLLGSYAIAACFFWWLFGKTSPWHPEEVSDADAALVWETVKDLIR